jgi:TolB-like protein/DNA-binding winged helix-turn-helix (wHTH) protein/Tfp pilus assembly protein PilF
MSLAEKEIYNFGHFTLDPAERALSCEGKPLSLTPKAFDTLLYLVRNPGRLLTKDELLKQVWPGTFVEEVNLAVNISVIRKALGENPQDCRYIATVPGRGYRFVAEVSNVLVCNGNGRLVDVSAKSTSALPIEEHAIDSVSGEDAGHDEVTGFTYPRPLILLPVAVVLVFLIGAALGAYFWNRRDKTMASTSAPASIAVLPFVDLSPGHDQEYFSDGLAEELTNDLAKVSDLKVVARSSCFQFKGKNEDLRSIGRKLGVANVLEGSIRREGDRVRIRAELVKAEDGFQLWSESYDRKIDDIFQIQDEIARSVTGALQLKLLGAEDGASTSRDRSSNAAAYDAFLHARYFVTRGRDKADLDNALAYCEQAIMVDSKYASAWALRSYIVDTMAEVELMEPATAFRMAREDAERAIELDSNDAAGYLALAWVQINRDWNWEGAELSLKKAAELEPGSASLLRYRSFLSHSLGRLNEAIAFHQQAITLDPLFASSHSYLAFLHFAAGDYDKAEASARKALELNPQKTYDHFILGEILLARGRALESLTELKQEPAPFWKLTGQALAYHALGNNRESTAALTRLINDHQKYMAYQIAQIYADRGDADKAFQWLDRAYQQHDAGMRDLKIDPWLRGVRGDPRYAELLKKMNLPS